MIYVGLDDFYVGRVDASIRVERIFVIAVILVIFVPQEFAAEQWIKR